MLQAGFDIDWLVEHGFASDILKMLQGENEYADLDAFESLDRHSHHLRLMTVQHLEFIIDHGDQKEPVKVGRKIISPHPEYFMAWKLACCPGISLHQLSRLLESKRPIPVQM
ncbi:hypothetical protein [Phyllobacterium sp. K27]